MRPRGTPQELENRRRRAIELLQEGLPQREVARRVGASSGSVWRWKQAWEKDGDVALDAKPHPGPEPWLTERQLEELAKILLAGAVARGYATELWTLPRVAAVIEEEFGVSYHPAHVWKILHKMGWSCQKPERRARERNEDEVRRWREDRWPHIKKRAR